ncbi:hypothetical protein PAXRUDRAFT_18867 [Paxillus rubicundulus Ve08.2h10]|uniref:Uncharacterized protein n=1 Tax=Paxillus rubicundulus Ve08.2h10 TaxID=930991 RepID=A0A0D0CWV0_9AGAM|nr:hypothetical protein PAXRUDRAFT_18867 [Paxillus rubicundulus Ve08.2h10]
MHGGGNVLQDKGPFQADNGRVPPSPGSPVLLPPPPHSPPVPLPPPVLLPPPVPLPLPVPLPPPPQSPPVQHPLQRRLQSCQPSPPRPHPGPDAGDGNNIHFEHRQPLDINIQELMDSAVLHCIREELEFVMMIQAASLDDPVNKMSAEGVQRVRLSISMYLALEHSSQDAYKQIQRSIQLNLSNSPATEDILSFHAVEKKIASYTGVEYIETDMCPESCVGFTGPFAGLESCPIASCSTSRWDPGRLHAGNGHVKVAAKKITTIPLGPQLQAQYCDPQSAHAMRYLYERTQEIIAHLRETGEIPVIDNITMGWDYLGPALDGDIKENDIVLMVSLNGAQLYEHKDLDC